MKLKYALFAQLVSNTAESRLLTRNFDASQERWHGSASAVALQRIAVS